MRTVISAIVRHSTMLWMPLVCLMSNALLKMPSSPRPSNITRPRCRVWTRYSSTILKRMSFHLQPSLLLSADHCPIFISMSTTLTRSPLFRFGDAWLCNNDAFLTSVLLA
ncbi:hypothetical protein BS78_06G035400 [Paspalum vaginatum]|nr:hypothetical protein BS78_06G035400 [Paspalum vaginatum]